MTNLSDPNVSITPALASWWVSLVVNAYPNATLASLIKTKMTMSPASSNAGTSYSAPTSTSNYDTLMNQMAGYGMSSLSVNALSDVGGKKNGATVL